MTGGAYPHANMAGIRPDAIPEANRTDEIVRRWYLDRLEFLYGHRGPATAEQVRLWRDTVKGPDEGAEFQEAMEIMAALHYVGGNGVERDIGEALRLWGYAADAEPFANYMLGLVYFNGAHGAPCNRLESWFRFQCAAYSGYGPAFRPLAVCYRHGLGIDPDPDAATEWERNAAAWEERSRGERECPDCGDGLVEA